MAKTFAIARKGVATAVAGSMLAAAMAPLGAAAKPVAHHAAPAAPVAPARMPTTPPRLIVAIAVDQYSADLFAQYRQHYTQGLGRLLGGAVFPSGFQSHAATETCPGHSTILTGVHPSRSGIIANNWYDLTLSRDDKRVYCAEDEHDPNSTSKEPVVSAGHLRVPTLGERMKQQWPGARNVAVSGKDRAVMMMGGHDIDQAYWWQGRGFSTLSGRSLAPEALAENTRILATVAKGAAALPVPAWCTALARPMQAGPVTFGAGAFKLEPDQFDQYRVSPRLDAATLDLAANLAASMKLGKGPVPDLLAVSLSATDYIGHAVGNEGEEMCVQMAELDRGLGVFFARLDALGIDYQVVLTADHGGLDVPERLAQEAVPAAIRADKGLTGAALSQVIAGKLGLDKYRARKAEPGAMPPAPPPMLVAADGPFGDYWIDPALDSATRKEVRDQLVNLLRASPQVALALTHEEIGKLPMPAGNPQDWSLKDRMRASFDDQRSGDVVMLLNRTVVPIPEAGPGYTATHGSAWDYDRRVPMLFWRRGMPGFEQVQPVETVDIAPTLSAVLGLKVPEGSFDGRCLDLDPGAATTCR